MGEVGEYGPMYTVYMALYKWGGWGWRGLGYV